ncbi:MAG: hypothetical protein RLZZ417_2859 [Bacteroidota bacterium]|jgi:uncharacterized protein (TIGR02145 family)
MKKLFIVTICFFALVTSNGQIVQERLPGAEEISNRRTSFNLEEIKVRWKKAALENCTGVPCTGGTSGSFTCGTSTVADIDGNTYNTVLIGTQCWTKENLKVTKYNDGSNITLDASGGNFGTASETWTSQPAGARTIYKNDNTYFANYGYLYNWYAATDNRKICPDGWHIPSDSEWSTLETFLGGMTIAGGKMRTTGNILWAIGNVADNSSGFSGTPGGIRRADNGGYSAAEDNGWFWSDNQVDLNNAKSNRLRYDSDQFFRGNTKLKKEGHSIRCIKN